MLWLLLAIQLMAEPLEFSVATVTYSDGRYRIHTEVIIQRSRSAVQTVLHDFSNLSRVNSAIKSVTLLTANQPDSQRMRVQAGACIAFFCRAYSWVQDAVILASGDVDTVIDPALSDFREGRLSYRFIAENQHTTRLVFDAELVLDFWLPPLIGPWLVKQKLQSEALETARGVERLAQIDTRN